MKTSDVSQETLDSIYHSCFLKALFFYAYACVYICVSESAHVSVSVTTHLYPGKPKGVKCPEAGVTDICKPPDTGTRIQTDPHD